MHRTIICLKFAEGCQNMSKSFTSKETRWCVYHLKYKKENTNDLKINSATQFDI